MRASLLLLSVPGIAGQLRDVPADYVRERAGGKAEVRCPCRNRPVLELGELRPCRDLASSPHRCGRYFLRTRNAVLVANSPR